MKKDKASKVTSAGWRQEGHPAEMWCGTYACTGCHFNSFVEFRQRLGLFSSSSIWNSLPQTVLISDSLSVFKSIDLKLFYSLRLSLNTDSTWRQRLWSCDCMALYKFDYYYNYYFIPSVSIPEGGLKNWWKCLKGYDAQSVQSGTGRLLCSRTALKRCTSTETRWYKND